MIVKMISARILFFSFLICLLSAAQTAFSLEIPAEPKGRVSDYAGLLTAEQVATLDAKLQRYEEETTNQIAVAVFKTLEGESLEDFSIRLAEQWKIGAKERDNGVILLILLDDRKMRIEVGYGLEGTLTDATASSIIRNDIVPRFRQGDYYGGIEEGIEKIIAATKSEYKAEPIADKRNDIGLEGMLFAALFFIFPLFILPILARRRGHYTFGPGGWYSGGSYSGGGGSSDGGFSGGGGDFGGGGASGDW